MTLVTIDFSFVAHTLRANISLTSSVQRVFVKV
jgi:hypothetical protein